MSDSILLPLNTATGLKRVELLATYHAALTASLTQLDDRQAFSAAIYGAVTLLGYTVRDIAWQCNCHFSTVPRWLKGEVAPCAGMKYVIYQKLQAEAHRQLFVTCTETIRKQVVMRR